MPIIHLTCTFWDEPSSEASIRLWGGGGGGGGHSISQKQFLVRHLHEGPKWKINTI